MTWSSTYTKFPHSPLALTILSFLLMCQQCSHSIPVGPVINRFFILNELTLTVYLPFYGMLTLLHCSSSNVEFAWSFIKETILYAISLFTPQNRVKSHSQPVWFHHDIRHQLNNINSLRKLCKRSPTTNNRGHLPATEYQLQCDIRKAKANYEDHLVSNFAFSNDSKIYQYIRSLSGKDKLPKVMFCNWFSVVTAVEKADLFNEFFHSVFSTNSDTPSLNISSVPDCSLCSISITLEDTFYALSTLTPPKLWEEIVYHQSSLNMQLLRNPYITFFLFVYQNHTYLQNGVVIASPPFLSLVIGLLSPTTVQFLYYAVSPKFLRD